MGAIFNSLGRTVAAGVIVLIIIVLIPTRRRAT